MGRQRMIRPEFFTDGELAELPPLTRLLFIGLWTMADREGRLKDRPKSIKLSLFPADECDIDAMLADLAEVNCIRRYEVDGDRFIDIPGFITYQRVHPKEAPSVLPSYKRPKTPPLQESRVKVATSREKVSSLDVDVSLKQGPRAVVRKEQPEALSPRAGGSFDDFWGPYPNKTGKADAQKKWRRLSPADRTSAVKASVLMGVAVAGGYREPQYCPGGLTFINQRRWEDWEEGPPAGYGPNGNGKKKECHRCGVTLTYDESDTLRCGVCGLVPS